MNEKQTALPRLKKARQPRSHSRFLSSWTMDSKTNWPNWSLLVKTGHLQKLIKVTKKVVGRECSLKKKWVGIRLTDIATMLVTWAPSKARKKTTLTKRFSLRTTQCKRLTKCGPSTLVGKTEQVYFNMPLCTKAMKDLWQQGRALLNHPILSNNR